MDRLVGALSAFTSRTDLSALSMQRVIEIPIEAIVDGEVVTIDTKAIPTIQKRQ